LPLRSARLLLGLAALLFAANVIAQQTTAQALAAWEAQGRADGLARPDIECQDFLQAMGRKPAGLEYSGCSQDDASCIKPMQAHYRVPGTQAVKVEAYLRETFGMPALRYACCGWSNGAPYYWRDGPDAVRYQIGMGVESLPHERGDWHRIEAFIVTVEVLRQGPWRGCSGRFDDLGCAQGYPQRNCHEGCWMPAALQSTGLFGADDALGCSGSGRRLQRACTSACAGRHR
jgi:hypothetical protein